MNPPEGYTYPFAQSSNYGWIHPYYHQNPEYYHYYNSSMFNQPQFSYFPSPSQNKIGITRTQVIKLEEDSGLNQNLLNYVEDSANKNIAKKFKKKKSQAKNLLKKENVYLHPVKEVQHKVKYFDPSAAPVVTTADYNLVESIQSELKLAEARGNKPQQTVNQLQHPQQYNQPFITFKFRRIKKKFKKYIRSKDEQNFGLKAEESDSENDQENSSQQEQSESDKKGSRSSSNYNKKKQQTHKKVSSKNSKTFKDQKY